MDIKKVKDELEMALVNVDEAKDGDRTALKDFYRAVANARAIADSANVRSEEQIALQQVVHIAAEALERSIG
jgi:hypothetical protein